MQPYFMPYLGYWQLLSAANTIVLLDDAAFMPRGWVHRNRILVGNKEHLFTIPLLGASQNRRICDINRVCDGKVIQKLLKTVEQSYRHSPYLDQCFPLVRACLDQPSQNLSDYIVGSIEQILRALGIERRILRSSESFTHLDAKGEHRILSICAEMSATRYVNLPGGRALYSNTHFLERGIELLFLRPMLHPYPQPSREFVPGLSIIDALLNLGINAVSTQVQLTALDPP